MDEIPTNCVLNKGITGCGATELAINQSGHTIIAMPYVNLVKNKEKGNERIKYELLGVYEGVTQDDISEYVKEHSTLKILTTYDSLPRTVSALQRCGIDVYDDVILLVDEYHSMFHC